METKSAIIDNIRYINFITFIFCTLIFFLICPDTVIVYELFA